MCVCIYISLNYFYYLYELIRYIQRKNKCIIVICLIILHLYNVCYIKYGVITSNSLLSNCAPSSTLLSTVSPINGDRSPRTIKPPHQRGGLKNQTRCHKSITYKIFRNESTKNQPTLSYDLDLLVELGQAL